MSIPPESLKPGDADAHKPLVIPVILGTARQGRRSEHIVRFVAGRLADFPGVETTIVDIRELKLSMKDAGENIKDPEFSSLCMRADAFVIVAPEYNHGYPGLLKHALDTNLKEYIHKAVGVCGVSAGNFGGTRAIENLLPVLRELGLVTIFGDGNFSSVHKAFDAEGALVEIAYVRRIEKFLRELIWMARVLRHGRENAALFEDPPTNAAETRVRESPPRIAWPIFGTGMNRHAEKVDPSLSPIGQDVQAAALFGGVLQEFHTCPRCRYVLERRVG
jgi:NAD(P)H-dependent FMN reductase